MSLITVALPVYNAMPFLPETVDSLLVQSRSDFEILIINDGSNDGSADYLNSLTDPRLRVIHQENRGLTATLNRMLEEVRTPWMVRQDADDVAYPERIARIASAIAEFPDAGMFYSLADYYPKGASVGTFRTTVADPVKLRDLTCQGYLLAICHPTVCLNVEKTLKLRGYRFDLHVEDIDLWWRMALNYDIRLIPEKLLGFRHNLGSVSQTNLERQTVNTLYIQYHLISHLQGKVPLPYQEAVTTLGALVNRRHLIFREYMRQTNIAIGRGKLLDAARKGLCACAASPRSFLQRFAYEFCGDKTAVNGEDPALFTLHGDKLWPGGKI